MPETQFVVVARASSCARFRENEHIRVLDYPAQDGRVDMTFHTRWAEEGQVVRIPRELYVEIRGRAPSIEEAISGFTSAASGIVAFIAVAANAVTRPLETHLAYGVEPPEREFFQSFLPGEIGIPFQGRRIDPEATVALIRAITTHPQRKRLQIAASQYSHAIQHWRPGEELEAVVHLFMGAESLADAMLKQHLESEGVAEEELAESWGITTLGRTTRGWKDDLKSEARLRFVFHGDSECHRRAKKVSEGAEHGYEHIGRLRQMASPIRDICSRHLRMAILELAAPEDPSLSILTSDKYGFPLALFPYSSYLRGKLLGDVADPSAPGNAFPVVHWTRSVGSISIDADDQFHIKFTDNYSPRTAEGIQFRLESIEMWGPRDHRPANEPRLDVVHAGVRPRPDEPGVTKLLPSEDRARAEPSGK